MNIETKNYIEKHSLNLKEIENPFKEFPNYNCFACSQQSEIGLKMRFYNDLDSDYVYNFFNFSDLYAGFPGIMHGGIQGTILDEVGFWTNLGKNEKFSFTTSMNLKLKATVPTNQSLITRGKILNQKRRISTIYTEIIDFENSVLAVSTSEYIFMSKNMFIKKFSNEEVAEKFSIYLT